MEEALAKRSLVSFGSKIRTVDTAAKILVVGGMLNLLYGFVTGIFLSNVRKRQAEAPKYLTLAHMGPLMQGPMLLGLVFAVDLSPLPGNLEVAAALLLIIGTLLLDAKDTLHWLGGIKDEFAEKPVGYYLAMVAVPASSVGMAILIWGVFQGL